eukprot:758190-Hanusia_phi.AAC.6
MNDLSTASYRRTNLTSESTKQSSSNARRQSDTGRFLTKTYARLGQARRTSEGLIEEIFIPELNIARPTSNEPARNPSDWKLEPDLSVMWDDCRKLSESYLGGAVKALQHPFVY